MEIKKQNKKKNVRKIVVNLDKERNLMIRNKKKSAIHNAMEKGPS
jgi:hypothetical protein